LFRWEHPTEGMIPPDRFIGVAEQTGLMPALGSRILRMAIRQVQAWPQAGTPIRVR
jgi:EAL domain-containing protein (putative c-di-GMP-specific phosphodiesterase class I)